MLTSVLLLWLGHHEMRRNRMGHYWLMAHWRVLSAGNLHVRRNGNGAARIHARGKGRNTELGRHSTGRNQTRRRRRKIHGMLSKAMCVRE